MRVFVMRHGEAMPHSGSDSMRPLTTIGYEQVTASAKWLSNTLPVIDHVLVSPYVRAKQTLETVAEQVTCVHTEVTEDVTPAGNPRVASDYIRYLFNAKERNIRSVLLVSHMPFVSYLIDELVCKTNSLLFTTAMIIEVTFDTDTDTFRITEQFPPRLASQ